MDKGEIIHEPPQYPKRPQHPTLVHPKDFPSHKKAGASLPVYLLHSLAHIELNAVDMVFDLILRFHTTIDKLPEDLQSQYYEDWLSLAHDESRHFTLLCDRMEQLGYHYGSFLAHNNLWQTVINSKSDIKKRIAQMQLVQEARALDSHDRLVQKVGRLVKKKKKKNASFFKFLFFGNHLSLHRVVCVSWFESFN